ncbi:MAG: hypothetical protein JXR34_12780 [Bacteroidales bacterium]|nr:hypothetical protein [Bacteroidales bacterium]
MAVEIIPTNRKALKINIDTPFYGSFAEIGGGQEVARHFFQAGGSSLTVAKTISAYDKSFSDALYNQGQQGRYVSEDRLLKMLDAEYRQVENLVNEQNHEKLLFAFADTFEILNYQKTNSGNGWMGIKFQLKPNSEPNTIILHVKLLENDGLLQQATIGVLGVNLVYACAYHHKYPNVFLQSLLENLSKDRFRITMIRMDGPDLEYVDNRLLAVQLVKHGITHAIMFDKEGQVQQPSDMLYKKNVLAFRGHFKPITNIAMDIIDQSLSLFKRDENYEQGNTLFFCELTLNDITNQGVIDEKDFLQRVDMLNMMGQNVMVSDFREFHKLTAFFSQFKMKQLRIILGVPNLQTILDKSSYSDLDGGIMEALAMLFRKNTKMYIYPTKTERDAELVSSKDVFLEADVKNLYEYLIKNKLILDITPRHIDELSIRSKEVLQLIGEHRDDWKKYVPKQVADFIIQKRLFSII